MIFRQEQFHWVYSFSMVQKTTARWRCSHMKKEQRNAPILPKATLYISHFLYSLFTLILFLVHKEYLNKHAI